MQIHLVIVKLPFWGRRWNKGIPQELQNSVRRLLVLQRRGWARGGEGGWWEDPHKIRVWVRIEGRSLCCIHPVKNLPGPRSSHWEGPPAGRRWTSLSSKGHGGSGCGQEGIRPCQGCAIWGLICHLEELRFYSKEERDPMWDCKNGVTLISSCFWRTLLSSGSVTCRGTPRGCPHRYRTGSLLLFVYPGPHWCGHLSKPRVTVQVHCLFLVFYARTSLVHSLSASQQL